jgi:coenzyme PQQ precursor peptide PqqA
MPWQKPDFEEINLSGEVTAYVNSDDEVRKSERSTTRIESAAAAGEQSETATA